MSDGFPEISNKTKITKGIKIAFIADVLATTQPVQNQFKLIFCSSGHNVSESSICSGYVCLSCGRACQYFMIEKGLFIVSMVTAQTAKTIPSL